MGQLRRWLHPKKLLLHWGALKICEGSGLLWAKGQKWPCGAMDRVGHQATTGNRSNTGATILKMIQVLNVRVNPERRPRKKKMKRFKSWSNHWNQCTMTPIQLMQYIWSEMIVCLHKNTNKSTILRAGGNYPKKTTTGSDTLKQWLTLFQPL